MGNKKQRPPRDYFYGEVLRLPPGTKSPDHYALLGVKYFETDHDAILRAALGRIRVLEACRVDVRPAYRNLAKQLLVDVREAQLTLLDPGRRREYDAALTGSSAVPDEVADEDKEVELATGTMLRNRYRVMGEVRRGGLGVVWEAMDKNLRRKVHISLLRQRLSADKAIRRRIEDAARTATDLEHPNLLRIDEVEDADGLLFVRSRVPEEGRSLIEAIESTPTLRLPPDEARRIIGEIAAALQAIHERNAAHGDLRPHNIFLAPSGRVLVADACVTRAVAEQTEAPPSRYREPEGEASAAGDLFALGCVAYQMLSGMPPFGVDPAHYVPKPLPDDVPEDLEVLIMRLLSREPSQRPASAAEVRDRLVAEEEAPRKRGWIYGGAAAAVLVLAVLAGLLFGGDDGPAPLDESRGAAAWRLIAEGRLDDAIKDLRAARIEFPEDESLKAPLAKALEGAAPRAPDMWTKQAMLAEAIALEPNDERQKLFASARAEAVRALEGVKVAAEPIAKKAVVRIRRGAVRLKRLVVDGREQPIDVDPHEVALAREDGRHEIAWLLVDAAGNERKGTTVVVVDNVAPDVRIVDPADGASLASGKVNVRVEVDEPNAPALTVRGRKLAVQKGVGADLFSLPDGEHEIVATVVDGAGNRGEARIKVVVDSSAPDVRLRVKRVVTRDGRTVIAGRIHSRVRALKIDGTPVRVAPDGAFSHVVQVAGDQDVPVVAVGATGLERKLSVAAVIDAKPPRVEFKWPRRDRRGTLLYGTREMDAGAVPLRLRSIDKTALRYEPSEGTVADGIWKLAPHEGKRTATLVAIDEAGNQARFSVTVEGHRATPHLKVKCPVKPVTRDATATLEIEADGLVFYNGKAFESGRHKVPLPEGDLTLDVRAVDRWGNESRWTRRVLVDRTPPELKLRGGPRRGVGEQELVFDANEEITTVTSGGRTLDINGRVVRVPAELKPGAKKFFVAAKDRAGNTTKVSFPLEVRNSVLVLDGKSAVKIELPNEEKLEEFTIECWVRGFEPERTMAILGNYLNSDFALMWSGKNDSYPYAVLYGSNSGRQSLQIKKPWKWREWTHVALSFDGKRARFFVNGSQQSSVALKERMRRGRAPLFIGAEPGRGNGAYFFKGAIDDVRLSRVARYQRAFRPVRFHRTDDRTILLLRFEGGARDARFRDSSGRGHHGKAVGKPIRQAEPR